MGTVLTKFLGGATCFIAVGTALGLGLGTGLSENRPVSECSLFFPAGQPPADSNDYQTPRQWARRELTTLKVTDLCHILEKQGASPSVVASASTLAESGRMTVVEGEPGLLKIAVTAPTEETATRLNTGLIAYLEESRSQFNRRQVEAEKSKFLESNAQVLRQGDAAERQLVALAQREWLNPPQQAQSHWPLAGIDSLKQVQATSEFGAGLSASRKFQAQACQLELRQEAALPGFVVLDGPDSRRQAYSSDWGLGGGLLGLGIYALAWRKRQKPS